MRHVTWWVHGIVALSFVAAIPHTKALHMLAGPAGVAVRDPAVGRDLPAEPEAGYATFADFLPRHLVDLDACTRCGRCHEACPATAAGLPLSPRDLVLDLQRAARCGPDPGIAPETLWSCMQCMACVEICPVGIEHVPMINLLRRGLIEHGRARRGAADGARGGRDERQLVRRAAPAPRARGRGSSTFEVRDARGSPSTCCGSSATTPASTPRNQRNTLALARLLRRGRRRLRDPPRRASAPRATTSVGRGRRGCSGASPRRTSRQICGCAFERILTSDPHGFNTLRNEYPALGAPWTADQVLHHSQLLGELLDAGALTVRAPLGRTVTYHDPCALGRYNGVYDAPRELLQRIGLELVEMPRNRDNSFCCGAGGGRIWMREPQAGRPSEDRIREAVALGDRVGSVRRRVPEGRDDVRGRDQDHGLGRPARAGGAVGAGRRGVRRSAATIDEEGRHGVGSRSVRREGRARHRRRQRHRARVAERLAAEGAQVVIADIDDEGGEARRGGERRDHVHAHRRVAGRRGRAARVGATVERFGKLDAVHANAGIESPPLMLADTPDEWFDRCMAVNASGIFLTCKHAIRHFLERGEGGAIVCTSSCTTSRRTRRSASTRSRRRAVGAIARAIAVEYATFGIRANADAPRRDATPMVEREIADSPDPDTQRQMIDGLQLMKRRAPPAEIAAAVAFLLSDDASFMTGASVPVDGGILAGCRARTC